MKSGAGNNDFKARGYIPDENRKYLIDQDISYDEIEAQHNWHIEDTDEVQWSKETKNAFVRVKAKFIQTHQICKED